MIYYSVLKDISGLAIVNSSLNKVYVCVYACMYVLGGKYYLEIPGGGGGYIRWKFHKEGQTLSGNSRVGEYFRQRFHNEGANISKKFQQINNKQSCINCPTF